MAGTVQLPETVQLPQSTSPIVALVTRQLVAWFCAVTLDLPKLPIEPINRAPLPPYQPSR